MHLEEEAPASAEDLDVERGPVAVKAGLKAESVDGVEKQRSGLQLHRLALLVLRQPHVHPPLPCRHPPRTPHNAWSLDFS